MNIQIEVSASYYAATTALVDLPDGKTWNDVKSWYVKWDTLYLFFKDGSEENITLNSGTTGIIDWQRPADTWIFEVDSDGYQTGEILADV